MEMQCRFDTSHGPFPNGVALRKHYDLEHAHEYVPNPGTRRGTCSKCLQNVSRGSFPSHKKFMHNGSSDAMFTDDGGASATHQVVGGYAPPGAVATLPSAPSPISRSRATNEQKGYCSRCRRPVKRKSIAKHLRSFHAIETEFGGAVGYWLATLPIEEPPMTLELQTTPSPPARTAADTGELPNVHDMTVNKIVVSTVTVLAMPGDVLSIEHLEAVLEWRDATAKMFEAVTHGQAN